MALATAQAAEDTVITFDGCAAWARRWWTSGAEARAWTIGGRGCGHDIASRGCWS